jgi:DNA mismatch endonuclease (patch repair protein)
VSANGARCEAGPTTRSRAFPCPELGTPGIELDHPKRRSSEAGEFIHRPNAVDDASDAMIELAVAMDPLSAEQRSALMRRVKSKDTKPEMVVRRMLHGMGYRYRLHGRGLPGTPDLVFPARAKVIFVNGCFWHGHTCARGTKPKTNAEFWQAKIDRNRSRDRAALRLLRTHGWQALTVWECSIVPKGMHSLKRRLAAFLGP